MLNNQLRKTAYTYIKNQMVKLHRHPDDTENPLAVPLNEILLLQQGLADPSPELVASLKQLFRGTVTEAEIDTHLVKPFQQPGFKR